MEVMEITEVFEKYYSKSNHDIELAEERFRDDMKKDSDLKNLYADWCDEMGYTERKGFKSYFLNKSEGENIWDTIFPNAEELEGYEFK